MKHNPDIPTQRELIAWAKSTKLHRHIGGIDYMKVEGIHDLLPIMGQRGRASQMNHEGAYWAPWRFASHAAPLVEALGLCVTCCLSLKKDEPEGHLQWVWWSCRMKMWNPGEPSYCAAACAAIRDKLKEKP